MTDITVIPDGSITSPTGFTAGATFAGIKTPGEDKKDLGLLYTEKPANVAGTFTTNSIVSPSVVLTKGIVNKGGQIKGLAVNSGCANCSVGEQGLIDAKEMASISAEKLGTKSEEIVVASTGVIGVELPMALIRDHIPTLTLDKSGGHELAKAILTTDTRVKEYAVSFEAGGTTITVGGMAKGSGMIHPNMATMLAFITTDAVVDITYLRQTLTEVVNLTFNQIDVDGDQSTNDTVLLLSNGLAKNTELSGDSPDSDKFKLAVHEVALYLAKEIARDGEGSQRLIEVIVEDAHTNNDALKAARSVASSMLVKTAVYGRDPNWGRILMAIGKTGITLDESRIKIFINDIQIVAEGKAIAYNIQSIVAALGESEVTLRVNLGCGTGKGESWGCDLTEEYVVFNSAYTT